MTSLERAAALLKSKNYTCVLCKKDAAYTSRLKGISPLLEWIASGADFSRFSAADKVVGKASALLFAFMEIKEVYAPVMSKTAIQVFDSKHIKATYDSLTSSINNSSGTGICPMEQAVLLIDDPNLALAKLTRTLCRFKDNPIK